MKILHLMILTYFSSSPHSEFASMVKVERCTIEDVKGCLCDGASPDPEPSSLADPSVAESGLPDLKNPQNTALVRIPLTPLHFEEHLLHCLENHSGTQDFICESQDKI